MLRSVKALRGYSVEALDGNIGRAVDFYFDDHRWTLRYLVADTTRWRPGRQVLISPESLRKPDWEKRVFPVSLTREKVEKGPGVDVHRPLSRQKEIELAQYYRWSPYWMATNPMVPAYGMAGVHALPESAREPKESKAATLEREDAHLRAVSELKGYRIHAIDGLIGHVDDFILNDLDWTIRYMVVDTGAWFHGGRVLISPQWIREMRWDEAEVVVDLTRQNVRRSPTYDPSEPVNEEYEKRLYDFYGRPWHGR